MGAGLHWVNGINPTVSLHLIRTYWVPRLLYGLEATQVLQKDISDISLYYKWLLKQTQHLPDKTADAAVYLMLGKPPIQAEIHRRIFTIFGSITRNYESVENQLAWRQLSVKTNSSHSWFIMVKSLLERYNLPSIYDLLRNPPGKFTWKDQVKRAVFSHWEEKTNKRWSFFQIVFKIPWHKEIKTGKESTMDQCWIWNNCHSESCCQV